MQTLEMYKIVPENRQKILKILDELLKLAIAEDQNHGFCVNCYEAGDLPDNAYVGLIKYNNNIAGFSLFLPLQKDILMMRNFYIFKDYRDLISVKETFGHKANFFLDKGYEKFHNWVDKKHNYIISMSLHALMGEIIGFVLTFVVLEHKFKNLLTDI
ncbi:MAG: hypothetical protein WC748_06955 [Legionellales bacterium]|jgi:hypothetical protein